MQHDVAETLTRVFPVPTRLLNGASLAGDPLAVLPVLYHLLWNQTLVAELRRSQQVAGLSHDSIMRSIRLIDELILDFDTA